MTSPPASRAQTDEKWDAYPETILEFCGPPPLRVDLRRPVSDDARRALPSLGLDAPFAVLTAENPAGANAEDAPTPREEVRREASNERRTDRLEDDLAARGVRFVPVDGVSPDGAYRERCLAALVTRETAVALARRYAQLAFFWFDGERFSLQPGIAERAPRPLP